MYGARGVGSQHRYGNGISFDHTVKMPYEQRRHKQRKIM